MPQTAPPFPRLLSALKRPAHRLLPWSFWTDASSPERQAIQKVYWDEEGWPRIEGGHGGKVLVDAPKDAIKTDAPLDHSMHEEFDTEKLHNEWNTLRVPFTDAMGTTGDGKLTLRGQGSLSNKHELSLVAKRWQAFNFDASVKVSYNPFSRSEEHV